MIRKDRNGRKRVHVTFILPSVDADTVQVAGEFNDWRPDLIMERGADGAWQASVDLERGRAFEFRYVLNGIEWINDPEADRYVPNPYGCDNSVIDLSAGKHA